MTGMLPPHMQALADVLHQELCDNSRDAALFGNCALYQPGSPHSEYYRAQAQVLTDKLEPLVSISRIIPVVRAVLGEVL